MFARSTSYELWYENIFYVLNRVNFTLFEVEFSKIIFSIWQALLHVISIHCSIISEYRKLIIDESRLRFVLCSFSGSKFIYSEIRMLIDFQSILTIPEANECLSRVDFRT